MSKKFLLIAAFATLVLAGPSTALAMGPVDGEVGAFYWMGDADSEGESVDADGPGLRAEVWFFKNVGASAEIFKLDIDDGGSDADVEYTNLDVKWRPFSPTENSFFALGAGWQKIDIDVFDTSGLRLVAEGRVGLAGFAYAYGRVAYFPSLDDFEFEGSPVASDLDGQEYDLGVAFEPGPFVTLWAGYRQNKISYSDPEGGGSGDLKVDGFYVGAGFHF